MDQNRKFRKGDKLESRPGFIYEVVGDETDGGKVRAKLVEWVDEPNQRYKWSTSVQKFEASSMRRWKLVSEGPAKRPNNRVTTVKAHEVRLGEHVRYLGVEFVVKSMKGKRGVWTFKAEDESIVVIDGTADVVVLGKRGRKHPPVVHFNQFAEEGTVTIQRNSRPGFGSYACGVVTLIDVYASSYDLVTCEQKCGEDARENHWRKATKKA